jgi:hypothetical protein
MLRTKWNVL